ncbi:MAG: FAD-binding protein [Saprospirales bacterium]|nr:FAD-binding protein [Saprospirales bacterium]
MNTRWTTLAESLEGELLFDELSRAIYATDASVYREQPLAVAYPRTTADIQQLVRYAGENNLSLIPRAGGTSLAGQCVGPGIVVDISRHLTQILEVNAKEGWVRVQPGVIRDELNRFLKPYGLFFGPNTSTSNRCTIGGMVGNNSCGSTSIAYGTTRDHVLEIQAVLSDGSLAYFKEGKPDENPLVVAFHQQIESLWSDENIRLKIRENYPKSSIHRRNTGYALDVLLDKWETGSLCPLLCGSEGTLAFFTEIKLHLEPLPPAAEVLVCAHFTTVDEALQAVLAAMQHKLYACELMDKTILDCTRENREQRKNRFFLEGDPGAIPMLEVRANKKEDAEKAADALIQSLQQKELGYAFPKVYPPETNRVWDLRKAGLGVLSHLPDQKKGVTCIEDTAVALEDLPAYIAEFRTLLAERFGQQSVYHAHAGAGELHLRPLLNLRDPADFQQFRAICETSAQLVKKYRGSLSGEHGDGRVRAEFIPQVLGEANYQLLRTIKSRWDPKNIFNPGKIVDPLPLDSHLRYSPEQPLRQLDTQFDFSATDGMLGAIEKCNGSGDCRKLATSGGTMCPSYMATQQEVDSTRARANALREFLNQEGEMPFDHAALHEVLDRCLSCKGCAAECPSNVDMATLKAEFQYQYQKIHGVSWRNRLFGHIDQLYKAAAILPAWSNIALQAPGLSTLIKKTLGIAPARSLPPISTQNIRSWYQRRPHLPVAKKTVFLFVDEFTRHLDAEVGIQAIQLLQALGYAVNWVEHPPSGRACFSKGLLDRARQLAEENVQLFSPLVSDSSPLLGIEPSGILSFRDEYPKIVSPHLREDARRLASHALTIEEFLSREFQAGYIDPTLFHQDARQIVLHGHCHQKALSAVEDTIWMLSIPENYSVEALPTGCCGMAGSFGYEKEHYELSMQIGELVLFPAVRKASSETILAAPGTSCRHQILDGTGRKALHPVSILFQALKK